MHPNPLKILVARFLVNLYHQVAVKLLVLEA